MKIFCIGYFMFLYDIVKQLYTYSKKVLPNKSRPLKEFLTNESLEKTLRFLDNHSGRLECVKDNGEL